MKKIKPIIKNIKKYKNNGFFKAKFIYTKYYKKLHIKEDEFLFESFSGDNFFGSPFYLFLELCKNEEYKYFKKYISIKSAFKKRLEKILEQYDIKDNVYIIIRNSNEYCKKLVEAKYLVNNVSFPTYFMRKDGQVYLNTWHGTPLKGLGRSIKDNPNSIGNVQRNFFYATHLLYPNKYTFEHMRKDYMIENLYTGKYLIAGYPCNDVFFKNEKKQKIREELGIENKKVIVYMPTWRDKLPGKKHNKQFFYIMHALFSMEQKLDEDTIVYVKLHHLASGKIVFGDFEKIRPFPSEYETYEFLNIADGLITDYSSVMFDFANTGRKIMLYSYDKEEYINTRSMYFDVNKLPFPSTDNIDVLCNEINNIYNYNKYEEFKKEFCNYDNAESSKNILNYLIKGEKNSKMDLIEGSTYHNNKPNVLIFAGELQKNGITTSLKALLNNVNLDEKNYILTFYKSKTDKNKLTINDFNDKVSYIPIMGQKNLSISDAIYQYLYFKLNINTKLVQKHIKNIFEQEIKRCYPYMKFEVVIHFTGYERHIMHLLGNMKAKKIIYTHNDLIKENKTKKNIHINSLKKAYDTYDNIVVVRESMKEEIIKNVKKANEQKISLVHNLNDIDTILSKSDEEIIFDKDTYCNHELEELQEILDNPSIKKIINIARYSKEKGMERLIDAFEKYRKGDENTYLIIVGGYGGNFKNIKEIVTSRELNNVILIKSLSNPYPILKKSDVFVLASLYEGLPMTIMEALILKKPVISTNITGPKEFLEQGYGHLVDDSEEGLLEGITKFYNGQLGDLKEFDAEKFNQNALSEFYKIINS